MKREKILASIVVIASMFSSVYAQTTPVFKPIVDVLNKARTDAIQNLTPQTIQQNPSNRYTLKMRPTMKDLSVMKDSYRPWVVIDGERHPMKLVDPKTRTFMYEYVMPKGRNSALYYYDLGYKVLMGNNKLSERMVQSKLFELDLTNRYVISMESERGIVGSQIAVVGRGFQEGDKIIVNGIEAETFYESSNALAFEIPALQADCCYKVELLSAGNILPVGELFVDNSELEVNVENIALHPSEKTELVFNLAEEAPGDGLNLDITTDIPLSIIMPEVTVPGGSRSVSVMLEGGEPGEGCLFITAAGYKEKVIPITVNP